MSKKAKRGHLHILESQDKGVRFLVFSYEPDIDWGKILMRELKKPTLTFPGGGKT